MEPGAEGDTCKAYCEKCRQQTTWTLIERVFHYIWKCVICGAERFGPPRLS
jgi:hypothetical protein